MWKKKGLLRILNNHLVDYPSPVNVNYFWSLGSIAGICLAIQVISGVFLAMHYVPHVDYAFLSVEHIMRDVNYGWLLRYMHANGASMFLLSAYIHMARGLYYGSYKSPRGIVWAIGVVIFLLMMGTAFIGYVLPWGQMSFWGATVITNLASAIPLIGPSIVEWLWGGFSVDNATLNRFFSLHYLLPFGIAAGVILHIAELHREGSNNPLGIHSKDVDKVTFYPYFYVKDFLFFWMFVLFFSYFIFFEPNVLGHPDNYIEANPMVTPAHIVPEWYFLPFYAILRSIPDKLGGVIAMVGAILILAALPLLNTSNIRSSFFRPLHKKFFWIFLANVVILGWIGGNPVEDPYVLIGQLSSLFYFAYFVLILPGLGLMERILIEHYLTMQDTKNA
jgi:quinol-cytochrome oxidoreductase complex cytochrome b subunit